MRMRSVWCAAAIAALSLGALSACDQQLAAQPARDHTADAGPAVQLASTGGTASSNRRAERETSEAAKPVRLIGGRPMWSDNRRYTAEENALYQFEQHGAELGAGTLDDFLAKAHRFVNTPPDGAMSLTRANGDRLLFDPKSHLFGVVRSDGAPRTVFKPETGQAYWEEQVASEGRTTPRRTARATDDRS